MERVLPICRICLNTSMECIDFQKPFKCKEKIGATILLNYLECLRLCTRLSINEDDDGPQCLCAACADELQIIYSFLQKAKKSQMILEENCLKHNDKVIEHIEISIENENNNEEENDDHDELLKLETANESNDGDNCYREDENKHQDVEVCNIIEFDEDEQQQKESSIKDSEISQNSRTDKSNRTYTTSHLLNIHLKYCERKQVKEVEYKSDACEICGKQFSTQRYLRQHMEIHQEIRKTLKCPYCDKEYVTTTALNSHERIHQGQTTECNECGKEFAHNYELKIHMRFHKRDFPFECPFCGKKFGIKGHLRTHMRQHQGIKLKCEECGKLFGTTKAVNEHSYTHTQMPYPCDFCHKAYPSRQKYKAHLQKLHLNEMKSKSIDLTQIQSLKISKKSTKRKKYSFVQVEEDEEEFEGNKDKLEENI